MLLVSNNFKAALINLIGKKHLLAPLSSLQYRYCSSAKTLHFQSCIPVNHQHTKTMLVLLVVADVLRGLKYQFRE